MEIAFDALSGVDLALMRILSMPLRQKARDVVCYEEAGREDHLLYYHLRGTRVYVWDGMERVRPRPGDILLLPMNSRYTTFVEGEQGADGFFIRFVLQEEHGRCVGLLGGPQWLLWDEEECLLPAFRQIADLSMGSVRHMAAKACLGKLLEEITRLRACGSHGDWLHGTMARMRENLREPIPLAELALGCGMSERTFSRRFREETGLSPVAYHRGLRIDKAMELLKSGLYTLEMVAEMQGFTDAAHLSRCIRKKTGMAAGSLRKKNAAPAVHRRGEKNDALSD